MLSFEKGGVANSFPAALMHDDVAELERFPGDGALEFAVELIQQLSPGLFVLDGPRDSNCPTADRGRALLLAVEILVFLSPASSPFGPFLTLPVRDSDRLDQ
jgi:hypothetical protein